MVWQPLLVCAFRNGHAFVFLAQNKTFDYCVVYSSSLDPCRNFAGPLVASQVRKVRRLRKLGNRSWVPFYWRTDIFSRPDKPRILFWTTVFGEWYSGLSASGTAELRYWHPFGGCADHCYIANDRRTLPVSDAVVFYACDLNASDLPSYRAEGQKWVLWSLEAPTTCDPSPLVSVEDAFNWTMTYRRDSDVVDAYAKVTQRSKPTSYSLERLEQTWRNKKVTAVWAVSHCSTFGKRENYVNELRRHMSVDVYGKCGNFSCSRDVRFACYQMFERKYFFILSFENTICRDYVTEKLYLALLYDIIPVTFGGADYQDVAPPGSYIDALQFKTPKDLADYLREVSENFVLYKSFFEWKGRYNVEPWVYYTFCELCTKLYSSSFSQRSVYPSIVQWWNQSSHCRAWNQETKELYR
ncbi:alpha-(1,3)-fucosyltransferase C isoform X2 [Rhipicephalus microplus]|uniref:alpha-(1,3)-fucosyltransferase C isoform X2 n=1 Tax=Rhipicephalus microplus TaxID=6941 RepID=UPI0018884E86|nr:alpha-(1,3)-fucosyltransferase C-like isoform X2 [Rhipicephalus microplus]